MGKEILACNEDRRRYTTTRNVTYATMITTDGTTSKYVVVRTQLNYWDGKPSSITLTEPHAQHIGTVTVLPGMRKTMPTDFLLHIARAFETLGWPAFSWELARKPEWLEGE